jgi:hypothetical protein
VGCDRFWLGEERSLLDVLVGCDRCGMGEERSLFEVFLWGSDRFLRCFGGARSRCGMGEGDRAK